MAMVIGRILIIIDEVPAVDVIDAPVSIVVNPVAGNLVGIYPEVARKVRVGQVNSGVRDGYYDPGTPRGGIPGRYRRDIRTGKSPGVARVQEASGIAMRSIR